MSELLGRPGIYLLMKELDMQVRLIFTRKDLLGTGIENIPFKVLNAIMEGRIKIEEHTHGALFDKNLNL